MPHCGIGEPFLQMAAESEPRFGQARHVKMDGSQAMDSAGDFWDYPCPNRGFGAAALMELDQAGCRG